MKVKMGDIGLDKWHERMEEHKRKGRKIIQYPKEDDKKLKSDH